MAVAMSPVRLNLKPVSTNEMYGGKKFKSKKARQFESDAAILLARNARQRILPNGDLTIHFRFGTTRQKDLSNNVKLLEDIIARHYGIDDRRFCGQTAVRVPVKKGEEFIIFQIAPFSHNDFPLLLVREN